MCRYRIYLTNASKGVASQGAEDVGGQASFGLDLAIKNNSHFRDIKP
jgi:hypothetical protein